MSRQYENISEYEPKTYRVQGLSCANCAKTFENNIRDLHGVRDVKVNFGASKIYVEGNTSIEEIERAGSFENLIIRHENDQKIERKPLWKQSESIKVYMSIILLFLGWLLANQLDESSFIPEIGYLLSILMGGYSLFIKGFKNLSKFRFDMNTLMTIAVIGAVLIGKWGEGATVVILFAISEALERFSMDKSRQSIESLMDMAPKRALIRRGHEDMIIHVDHIEIGDIMIVKPGQKLAMDGHITKGMSTLNQAAITGESMPVTKTINDDVYAGTLNEDGLLEVKVTKRVCDTTLSKIIHLVEEAQEERASSQKFVDKFAKYYTPIIIVLSILVAVMPPLLGSLDWNQWIYQGLAILVVGCPCALIVSTPVAVVTAIGNAAKNGVLIKGGIYLEEAGSLDMIAFDKTGTLTEGVPTVTDVVSFGMDKEEMLTILAAIEHNSQHPLARAIIQKSHEKGLDIKSVVVEDFQSMTGKGVCAKVNNERYYIGNMTLFKELQDRIKEPIITEMFQLQKAGKTVMIMGTESDIISLVAVTDKIRSKSKNVINQLNLLGIETMMLTGDNERVAETIGKQAGVSNVKACLLPEDKLNYIKKHSETNRRLAMVGDGINDAPALAASTVGVAMGGAGSDTALETADIALMSDDLDKLPYTIKLSRKSLAIIKQNISFSLIIKLLALLLVIPGWLTLWIAIFADMGATLLVTLNSLWLIRAKE